MKKSEKSVFLRRTKVLIFSTCLLLSGLNAFAGEPTERDRFSATYATFGHKKLPDGVKGTGMSYGAGFKRGLFGMEIYQTNYNTMPNGMERSSASFNGIIGGAGTKTGEVVVSDGGFGFDFNFYYPLVKRLELYAGPSMVFEKQSDVYTGAAAIAGTTSKYADFPGTMKTLFGGQLGIMTYVPIWKANIAVTTGYSTYRGFTAGIGIPF